MTGEFSKSILEGVIFDATQSDTITPLKTGVIWFFLFERILGLPFDFGILKSFWLVVLRVRV
jgi:hypothetical protein